ncbi:MAG: hypothetical protein QOJ79_1275 [Actinomycetota bacterium]|jgi:hypothetical protein|nr:hypothetical protein [Actinomycetota bacterium]
MTIMRTCVRLAAASALTLAWLPTGGPVQADAIDTETALAGFSVGVEASPLRILIDDPKLQIPRPTGTAALEADPNYTLASVAAGPNAHAITSSLWPGNLIGEGLAQVYDGLPAYPVKGEARYPDKPYTAQGVDGGPLSGARAEGLLATATADGTPTNKPGPVSIGGMTSTSTATVDDKDVAVGSALSAVKDVSLIEGLIGIDSVTTRLVTKADGSKPAATGSTTVEGLTIAGQSFTVDDKGLHAAGNGSGLPPLGTPQPVADALGISANLMTQTTTKSPNGVSRVAGGLVIKLDTGPLRKALGPVTDHTDPVVNDIISQMPPQLQGQLYYFVKATPNFTFIFGSANAASAATLPISFNFPTAGFPSLGSVAGPPTSLGTTPTVGASAPLASAGLPPAVSPAVARPLVPALGTSNVAARTPASSVGIGLGRVLAGLLLSGLIGWGLLRFLALAGGALPFGCRLGAPTSVPNLRSVTA